MKRPTTQQSMTHTLVTVKWNTSIRQAHELMGERRIRHLPVTDEEGFVVGILSDRDVNRAMSPVRPGFMEDSLVGDFMSWPAITVDEKTSIKDVAEGMVDEKVSAFLVTKGGEQVVGIITSEDLLRLLKEMLKDEPGRLLPYTPILTEAIKELSSAGI